MIKTPGIRFDIRPSSDPSLSTLLHHGGTHRQHALRMTSPKVNLRRPLNKTRHQIMQDTELTVAHPFSLTRGGRHNTIHVVEMRQAVAGHCH